MTWTPDEQAAAVELGIDIDRIEDVAGRLDLRSPNQDALETLIAVQAGHYVGDRRPPPFECVLDLATGVGKTYVIAAAIEYFASADAVRNFAIIAPGTTILNKTCANFTAGHRKSLLDTMESDPVLITADNFNSPAVKTLIEDDTRTKLYVFTVQSLLSPTTKTGRKTHDFTESLGAGFYEYLTRLDDLTVFADEHHCYSGPAFSKAVRGLEPHALIGLTATPDPKTSVDELIFRYPLAAAIADGYVKAPVIVGRHDDRHDPETKLGDGVQLLDFKQAVLDVYCAEHNLPPVHPVMLVVAQSTADADEFAAILDSTSFDGGRWRGTVLTVHSNLTGAEKEDALDALDKVDEPGSPVRVIISVGMLKEGWDVKSVYVITSLRASVSTVLTEQTLGRGLRLPFGHLTGEEALDTLEVVAHEKYADLLKKKDALNESFVDSRTSALLVRDADGKPVVDSETSPIIETGFGVPDDLPDDTASDRSSDGSGGESVTSDTPSDGSVRPSSRPSIESIEDRTKRLRDEASKKHLTVVEPTPGLNPISVPVLAAGPVATRFSLTDIINFDPFVIVGHRLELPDDTDLKRDVIVAEVITDTEGGKTTRTRTREAAEKVVAANAHVDLVEARERLITMVLQSPSVPAQLTELEPASRIVDEFLSGLGDRAEVTLATRMDLAARRLNALIAREAKTFTGNNPAMADKVVYVTLDKTRQSSKMPSDDRKGRFERGVPYTGWSKAAYPSNWFDSEPERHVANMVDSSDHVDRWCRLLTGDLQIVWGGEGRMYNPDLVVVGADSINWVVEVKADRSVDDVDVRAKRDSALRWANKVNSHNLSDRIWRYLLVAETDIKDAHDSWQTLTTLGQ